MPGLGEGTGFFLVPCLSTFSVAGDLQSDLFFPPVWSSIAGVVCPIILLFRAEGLADRR